MLKLLIVMVPMLVGAALASTVRADTLIATPADGAPASAMVAHTSAPMPSTSFVFADRASPARLPEPATWAMMMTGIGAVGAVSRRRRALGSAAVA